MKRLSTVFGKAADFADKIVYIIGGAGLVTCAGMCAANILMWWFMGKRIAVCDEISLFGLVWSTYIGMGILYRHNGHVSMDFLVKALPPRAGIVVRIITDLAILVVAGITIYYSWQLALKSFNKKFVLTKIPYFYVDISITIGYAHLFILVIGDIIKNVDLLIHWNGKEDK